MIKVWKIFRESSKVHFRKIHIYQPRRGMGPKVQSYIHESFRTLTNPIGSKTLSKKTVLTYTNSQGYPSNENNSETSQSLNFKGTHLDKDIVTVSYSKNYSD